MIYLRLSIKLILTIFNKLINTEYWVNYIIDTNIDKYSKKFFEFINISPSKYFVNNYKNKKFKDWITNGLVVSIRKKTLELIVLYKIILLIRIEIFTLYKKQLPYD